MHRYGIQHDGTTETNVHVQKDERKGQSPLDHELSCDDRSLYFIHNSMDCPYVQRLLV